METDKTRNSPIPQYDFNDFLENSLCGFVTTDPGGVILHANSRFLEWTEQKLNEVLGRKFSDFLTVGGKIYYETHLWPLLRMQKYFDEVALELSRNGSPKMPVLVNAYERRNAEDIPQFVQLTIFKATDRRTFEKSLLDAKSLAELNLSTAVQMSGLKDQFIAILGHDLRNPLGAITAGGSILAESELSENDHKIVQVINRSSARMAELIQNIMDFAHTRLGGGIVLQRESTDLIPVLSQVVEEIKIIWPGRVIITNFDINCPVNCDKNRVAQVLSNLLANVITHGASDQPVTVQSECRNNEFELSVINKGNPIPAKY